MEKITQKIARFILQNRIKKDKKLNKIYLLDDIWQIANHAFTNQHTLSATYAELGSFFVNSGQPELAEDYYKLSLKRSFTPGVFSQYLQCLLLNPACTEQRMLGEAKKYNRFFTGIQPHNNHQNTLDPQRKLNIGYICHFFHNCVSQSLLLPFLQQHNKDRVNIHCYSDTAPDEVPAAIKSIADTWHDTKHMSDEALTDLIQKEKIDILLELNGHCIVNRYGVIARKAAPIQVSFYNIAATTGLNTIDYVMIGDEADVNQSRSFYTESIYQLKGVTGTAQFPDTFPACSPLPSLKNGYITFGSFGAAHKVNADVIRLWCRVLQQVPHSRFYMKAAVLSQEPYKLAYKKLFTEQNVDINRIHLEGFSEHHEMLKCYANVDIALDTYPHCAGTTTMEALWQGVPVISLCGDKYSSQNGKMILTSINHPELIAYSEDEFVAKAAELANQQPRLVAYRQQLREDFKNSPRADAKAFAAKLEDAYFDMWATYCKNNAKIKIG